MKKSTGATGSFDLESLAAYRHLPRGEFVSWALKDAFANGRFQSGDRIREEEIAQALGVSRTPVREVLEGTAARLAAQHASTFEIEQFSAVLGQFIASAGDVEKLRRFNRLFHQAIYLGAFARWRPQSPSANRPGITVTT